MGLPPKGRIAIRWLIWATLLVVVWTGQRYGEPVASVAWADVVFFLLGLGWLVYLAYWWGRESETGRSGKG
jgi:hypothetical protein